MQRFNITSKGYKFDKYIFWGVTGVIVLLLGFQLFINGYKFEPYFECKSSDNMLCENPFYGEGGYECSFAFGMVECPVKYYDWLDDEYLSPGVYGKTSPLGGIPKLMFGLFILGFVLNHFIHNKGKPFHLNIMDKMEKVKMED